MSGCMATGAIFTQTDLPLDPLLGADALFSIFCSSTNQHLLDSSPEPVWNPLQNMDHLPSSAPPSLPSPAFPNDLLPCLRIPPVVSRLNLVSRSVSRPARNFPGHITLYHNLSHLYPILSQYNNRVKRYFPFDPCMERMASIISWQYIF